MTRAAAGIGLAIAAIVAAPLIVVVLFLGTSSGTPPGSGASAPASQAAGAIASSASVRQNEALGARMAVGYGWVPAGASCPPGRPGKSGCAQVSCLLKLWTRESGWSATAKNASSGAYGISQALGHLDAENRGQVTSALTALNLQGDNFPSSDAAGNPPPWGTSSPAAQIAWGLGYIKSTYRSPCAAWAHETADSWY